MTRRALAVAAVVAAVVGVYREAHTAYFFQDDFQWLAGTLTYDPRSIFALVNRDHFYRPVIELYFWAGAPLFNGSAALFHIANVVLHGVNGVLLYFVSRQVSDNDRFAFAAALLFVVMPGYVEAVAWVGALAEPVAALFGCLVILGFLAYRRSGRVLPLGLSVAAFTLALLTHESAVMWLPILVLVDWARDARKPLVPTTRAEWIKAVAAFGWYVAVLVLYFVPAWYVNEQSYLVTEGHYGVGFHAVRNAFDYIAWLYVGKRNTASYVMIAIALGLIGLFGTRRARLSIGWMLLALLPFLFFTWANTSRYLYVPAMGFALLLAEGLESLDRVLARRVAPRWRLAIVGLLLAALAIRFSVFASKAVSNFAVRTHAYRTYAETIRQTYPSPPSGGMVSIDPEDERRLQRRYLEALIRWELRDPTIRIAIKQ